MRYEDGIYFQCTPQKQRNVSGGRIFNLTIKRPCSPLLPLAKASLPYGEAFIFPPWCYCILEMPEQFTPLSPNNNSMTMKKLRKRSLNRNQTRTKCYMESFYSLVDIVSHGSLVILENCWRSNSLAKTNKLLN